MSGQKVSYIQITDREYNRFMRSAREVEKVESRVQKQLQRQEQTIRKDFNHKIEQQKQKIKKQEKQLSLLDNKIDSVIQQIEAKESNQRNQASLWLEEAQNALTAVDSYKHEQFCPGEYAQLKQKLKMSQLNMKNEVYEASISSSQILWQEASQLKVRLEVLENEWNECFEEAVDSNLNLIATCEAQKTVKLAFETEGGNEELEVDIDYWCNGQLSKTKEIALSQKKILQYKEFIDLEQLKKFIQESAEYKEKALGLTQQAKEVIILSQLRSDMASDIVDSLDESGFELVDECFEGDDEREALHLKMQNISGDEVVTIITPVENRKNKLDIHFFDKGNDESFKQTRLQSMIQRLQESGVECETPKCAVGTEDHNSGDESVRDFQQVKNLQRR